MKKNIPGLLFTIFFCSEVYSQSFQFVENGTSVPAQPSYTRNVADTLADEFTLDCRNLSMASKTVAVKMTILATPAGCSNGVFFCDAVACYPPSVFQSPTPFTIAAGGTAVPALIPHIAAGTCCGDYAVGYSIFDIANTNDSAYVLVQYHVDGNHCTNGLPELNLYYSMGDAFPNPASKEFTIKYSLAFSSSAVFELYNSAGEKVKTLPVEIGNYEIQVHTDLLPGGIYFYSFLVNGERTAFKEVTIIK